MPENEQTKLPVYAGWNTAVKQFNAPAASVACLLLLGHNLLVGWKAGTDPATGKGGIPGGSLVGSETPRAACQRIVRGEIGLDLEPHYAAWVGQREFSVRGKPQPVYLFVCGLQWGSGRVNTDDWDEARVKRYQDGIQWRDPIAQPGSRYQTWQWIEIAAARASPQRLSPALQWAVEVITRPPPEVALPWEVQAIPLVQGGKVRHDD